VKKPLAALLLSAATVAALAVPAGAAVPKQPADLALQCGNQTARAWHTKKLLAGENPCQSQWLRVAWTAWSPRSGKLASNVIVNVAPGAHFNWAGRYVAPRGYSQHLYAFLDTAPMCGVLTVLPGSHGKPVDSDPCPDNGSG
jgi:hypothetical protein